MLAVALSMGDCANKNLGADGAMASAATPGSQQDFVVNVGDRVFFESDQTDLTPQAIVTLETQARWLQTYKRYAFTMKAMRTSVAPANTTLRLAPAVPNRFGPSWRRAHRSSRCGPSPTAGTSVAVCNDISCWSQNRRAVTV